MTKVNGRRSMDGRWWMERVGWMDGQMLMDIGRKLTDVERNYDGIRRVAMLTKLRRMAMEGG
jgi:hypothetical protein